MNRLKIYGIALFLAAMFVACNKNEEEKNPDVYVVGCEYDRQKSVWIAKFWKNGVAQNLFASESKTAGAHSVFVSGNDVYVAGYTDGDAILWKNGEAQKLTDGSYYAEAHSVFISGSDVYVAGIERGWVATLWKNGVAQTLPLMGVNSYCTVFVSKNDVYLAGDFLLKNGVEKNLSRDENATSIRTNSVYVSDNDEFVAGRETRFRDGQFYYCATLWKNGVAQYLTDERTEEVAATSVYVAGRDVYVTGNDCVDYTNDYGTFSMSVARLWKNGVAQDLTNGNENAFSSNAFSVFVSGRDVYVAGYERPKGEYVATIWKNGVAQNLTNGSSYADALCVFVK